MSSDLRAIESRIRREIVDGLGYVRSLTSSESLRQAAVFDSSNILDFVIFLEEEFGIQIDSEDMVLATFESIESIVAFVAAKWQVAAA
ncbi:MAG: acyl carrier protein [Deltaproteobacteria bacterium]|nr:acyl carrier protein [Deltaproteobacteria bacterium]